MSDKEDPCAAKQDRAPASGWSAIEYLLAIGVATVVAIAMLNATGTSVNGYIAHTDTRPSTYRATYMRQLGERRENGERRDPAERTQDWIALFPGDEYTRGPYARTGFVQSMGTERGRYVIAGTQITFTPEPAQYAVKPGADTRAYTGLLETRDGQESLRVEKDRQTYRRVTPSGQPLPARAASAP